MKKRILISAVGLALSFSVWADEPDARITFRVRDDAGAVVTGAVVQMSTFERWVPGSEFGKDVQRRVVGVTDTNGVVVLQIPSLSGSVKYGVHVKGQYFDNAIKMDIAGATYYRDMGSVLNLANSVEGKWQPWNALIELELKRVINPIPMYARAYGPDWDRHKMPEYGKAIGFDLIKGDWVAPYGRGDTSDFIFTLDCTLGGQTSNKYQIFDATLRLSFANEGDGIQSILSHPLKGSVLRLPRFAPEAGYATNWAKATFRHEGESLHEMREDQNYFFRVRTKKDETGRIVSALYGKLYGMIDYEIRSTGNHLQFAYYLNPTPNDRNVEFDPGRNLFEDLDPLERVTMP